MILVKEVYKQATKINHATNLERTWRLAKKEHLCDRIKDKKIMVILDDVWDKIDLRLWNLLVIVMC